MNTRLMPEIIEAEELNLNGKTRHSRIETARKGQLRKEILKARPRRKFIRAAQWRNVNQLIVTFGAGFLPIASYVIAHMEAQQDPRLWVLVAACLICSAPTLATWAKIWTGKGWLGHVKAWGFTVLLEGTMIFSHTEPLRIGGMLLLVVINAAYGFHQARKHTV